MLANLYCSQGKYEESEKLFKRAREILEKGLGPNHIKVAQLLHDMAAKLYEKQANYNEAENLYKKSLTIRKMVLGDSHPDVAETLHSLANLYA